MVVVQVDCGDLVDIADVANHRRISVGRVGQRAAVQLSEGAIRACGAVDVIAQQVALAVVRPIEGHTIAAHGRAEAAWCSGSSGIDRWAGPTAEQLDSCDRWVIGHTAQHDGQVAIGYGDSIERKHNRTVDCARCGEDIEVLAQYNPFSFDIEEAFAHRIVPTEALSEVQAQIDHRGPPRGQVIGEHALAHCHVADITTVGLVEQVVSCVGDRVNRVAFIDRRSGLEGAGIGLPEVARAIGVVADACHIEALESLAAGRRTARQPCGDRKAIEANLHRSNGALMAGHQPGVHHCVEEAPTLGCRGRVAAANLGKRAAIGAVVGIDRTQRRVADQEQLKALNGSWIRQVDGAANAGGGRAEGLRRKLNDRAAVAGGWPPNYQLHILILRAAQEDPGLLEIVVQVAQRPKNGSGHSERLAARVEVQLQAVNLGVIACRVEPDRAADAQRAPAGRVDVKGCALVAVRTKRQIEPIGLGADKAGRLTVFIG